MVPLLLKPAMDTRDGNDFMRSRLGLISKCEHVEDYITSDFAETKEKVQSFNVVIIDEVQFLEPELIHSIQYISHSLNIPVFCYGLKDDFLLKLFPMSEKLLHAADIVQEMPILCWCGKRATCNARIGKDGTVARSGERYVLGGNDLYTALCFEHYSLGQTEMIDYFETKEG